MAALRFTPSKSQDFSKETELLAEALQRTLIIEGMTKEKAKEETIEKTIEICRKSAHSDVVRSILGASSFSTPQEVISKFIVENTTDKSEKQILAFRAYQSKQRTQTRGRGNFRGQNSRNQYHSQYNNQNNDGNYRNNNNSNWRGQNRYRGRGRGNGRGNYGNNRNAQINMLENTTAPASGAQQIERINQAHQE